jgi:hypothetical protein
MMNSFPKGTGVGEELQSIMFPSGVLRAKVQANNVYDHLELSPESKLLFVKSARMQGRFGLDLSLISTRKD